MSSLFLSVEYPGPWSFTEVLYWCRQHRDGMCRFDVRDGSVPRFEKLRYFGTFEEDPDCREWWIDERAEYSLAH